MEKLTIQDYKAQADELTVREFGEPVKVEDVRRWIKNEVLPSAIICEKIEIAGKETPYEICRSRIEKKLATDTAVIHQEDAFNWNLEQLANAMDYVFNDYFYDYEATKEEKQILIETLPEVANNPRLAKGIMAHIGIKNQKLKEYEKTESELRDTQVKFITLLLCETKKKNPEIYKRGRILVQKQYLSKCTGEETSPMCEVYENELRAYQIADRLCGENDSYYEIFTKVMKQS